MKILLSYFLLTIRSGDGQYGAGLCRVWVEDHYHLSFVAIVLHGTFGEDGEWSSEQNVVGRVPNNMNLHIKSDTTNYARYVSH